MHTADPAPVPIPAAGEPSVPKCPIDHNSIKSDPNNPLNQIPANLSLKRQPNQTLDLPTERTVSTIPRPQTQEDDGTTWDYPSPQQFYNALVRKGWETPEDSVEMMVDIHNFLNEEAWQEVMKWEKKLPGYVSLPLLHFSRSLLRPHHFDEPMDLRSRSEPGPCAESEKLALTLV